MLPDNDAQKGRTPGLADVKVRLLWFCFRITEMGTLGLSNSHCLSSLSITDSICPGKATLFARFCIFYKPTESIRSGTITDRAVSRKLEVGLRTEPGGHGGVDIKKGRVISLVRLRDPQVIRPSTGSIITWQTNCRVSPLPKICQRFVPTHWGSHQDGIY